MLDGKCFFNSCSKPLSGTLVNTSKLTVMYLGPMLISCRVFTNSSVVNTPCENLNGAQLLNQVFRQVVCCCSYGTDDKSEWHIFLIKCWAAHKFCGVTWSLDVHSYSFPAAGPFSSEQWNLWNPSGFCNSWSLAMVPQFSSHTLSSTWQLWHSPCLLAKHHFFHFP